MNAPGRSFVVGTAGHVDHGKTTLIRALTGVDTDRFREEKERGLTIDIGFAHLDLPGGARLGIVDVPGHRDFLGNMLTGTTGLDAVLLVVSAAEGPMPQTREHLQIAELLGIRAGVVALTNVDRVDPEFADLAEEAVREELEAVLGADAAGGWPIVRVDALGGAGVGDMRDALSALAGRLRPPPPDPVFRLPVDRSFTVAGTGTVVTGTTWSGRVSVGDRVRVLPGGAEARVRSIQSHGETLEEVGARRRAATALVGLATDDVGRGDTLVSTDAWRPARRLGVAFRLLPGSGRVIEHDLRLRAWLGTREVMARIHLPRRAAAFPGERGVAVLACEEPLVARAGDRCVLRFYSPVELLGGARVAEIDPPRDWESRIEDWAAVLGGDPGAATAAAVRLAGGRGTDAEELRLAVPPPAMDPGATDDARRIGERWFAAGRIAALADRFEGWLADEHAAAPRAPAVPLESLRAASDGSEAPELVEAAIADLVAAGRVVTEGPDVRLAGHEVRLSEEEARIRDALFARIRAAGLMPEDPATLATELGAPRALVNDLLRLLVAAGEVVLVTPEVPIAAGAETRLRETAARVLATSDPEPVAPTEFRDALGVTRRYLIPLLEYLDGVGWTRRTGEGRIAGPAAAAGRR